MTQARPSPLSRIDRLLIPSRVFVYCVAPAVLLLAIFAYLVGAGHPPLNRNGDPDGGDLTAKLTGGRIALSGDMHHLYDAGRQSSVQQALLSGHAIHAVSRFDSPPVVAYLFAPFAAFPYLVGAALWALFSALLLAASIRLLWSASSGLTNLHRWGYGRILLLAFSTLPVVRLLISGQDSLVALLLLVAGLRLLLARRDGAAGAVLGLGVFKPQIFLLAPILLLLQRRWRALGTWVAVAVAMGAVSVALVGPAGVRDYLHFLAVESQRDGATTKIGLAWRIPSLFGLSQVVRALVPAPIGVAFMAASAAAGVVLLVWWGRNALRPARSDQELSLLFAGTVLVGALVNPHLLDYDATVLLLPALVLYDAAPRDARVRLLLLAAYLLAWWMAFLPPFLKDAPGPLPLLGAPWLVLPIVGLSIVAHRLLHRSRAGEDVPVAVLA